ncbi:MAG: hypothetical protein PHU67_00155 [Sulfurovum sp.]|nr:hypothetical protein [Sulfurovum sp.]
MKSKIIPFVLITLLLSGCASSLYEAAPSGTTVDTRVKENATIVFSRPSFLGAALHNTVVAFDPETKATSYVGTLGAQTKIEYQTTPGTHYFYMLGGENDDMIKVTTKASSQYYVVTEPQMGLVAGRFYFKPVRYGNVAAANRLLGKKCDSTLLTQYGFKKQEDGAKELLGVKQYHSPKYHIDIECKKSSVVKSKYTGYSFADVSEVQLVRKTMEGEKYYTGKLPEINKEIKEDFDNWIKEEASKTAVMPSDGKPL